MKHEYLNSPKLSPHDADAKFNERRESLLPEIRKLIGEYFKDQKLEITFAHQGISSIVCFLKAETESYVLKVPLSLTDGIGEADFLKKWEAAGVRVPHVFEDGMLGDHPYLLMEHVDAVPLTDAYEAGTAHPEAHTQMGNALAKMHTTSVEGFGRIVDGRGKFNSFKDWLFDEDVQKRIRFVQENQLLGDEHGPIDDVYEALLGYAQKNPNPTCCHFDFSPRNILATDPVTVIDPSPMANLGIIDIGRSMQISNGIVEHGDDMLRDGYFGDSEYDARALQASIVLSTYWKFLYLHRTNRFKHMDEMREYLLKGRHLL